MQNDRKYHRKINCIIGMKCDLVILFIVHVNLLSFLLQISIDDSNVPKIAYEIRALLDLRTAYQLFRDDEVKRIQRFLALYAEDFNTTVWSVANKCTYLYLPEDHLSVRLKVVDGGNTDFVKIFGSNKPNNTDVFSKFSVCN